MLSDREIMNLIEMGKLEINPFDDKRLGPVTYDIDTEAQGRVGPIVELVSKEEFILSRDIIGIIMCRSRIAKFGLFATFSPLVDPGYKGHLIFSVYQPGLPILWRHSGLFQIGFDYVVGEVAISYNERKSSTAMNRSGFDD